MSTALEVALFLASVAIILMAALVIPIAFQALRWMQNLALSIEQLKVRMEDLVQDSRELVNNINEISKQANRQMDDVSKMVGTVRTWTERADWLVNEVGSVIEPPVFAFVNKTRLFKLGVSTFIQFLIRRHMDGKSKNTQTIEE